jgi:SAM-dependent methyltransferase
MRPAHGPFHGLRAVARRWSRDLEPARRFRFRLVLRRLEVLGREPLRVLDVGCGEGLLAEAVAFARPTWDVIGVDTSEEMLNRGRARSKAVGLANLEFRHHDASKPLGTAVYDVVMAVECLEEIEHDNDAIRSFAAALRPGGLLVVHVPERDWTPVLRGSASTWRNEVRHGYSTDELAGKLSSAGLRVERMAPTCRGTIRLAQEIVDRMRPRRMIVRALLYPLTALALFLEGAGVTWGPPRALLAEADRPGESRDS